MCLDIQELETLRLEKGFIQGLEYEILRHPAGHRCGYLRVLPGHPWFGKSYKNDEGTFNPHVHGGITFAEPGKPCPTHGADAEWWVGFDCAHARDQPDPELIKLSTPEYQDQYNRTYKKYPDFRRQVRSQTYVLNELKNLAQQAIDAQAENNKALSEKCP